MTRRLELMSQYLDHELTVEDLIERVVYLEKELEGIINFYKLEEKNEICSRSTFINR